MEKKSAQLGMPHGTASINFCYRCKEEILSVEDVTIDHKIPWLDSEDPSGMFFDIENIDFSHLSCNCGNARQKNKIVPPHGTRWCKVCRGFKPTNEFPENYREHRCRECHSKNMSEWRSRKVERK